jgi:hypothetical protein
MLDSNIGTTSMCRCRNGSPPYHMSESIAKGARPPVWRNTRRIDDSGFERAAEEDDAECHCDAHSSGLDGLGVHPRSTPSRPARKLPESGPARDERPLPSRARSVVQPDTVRTLCVAPTRIPSPGVTPAPDIKADSPAAPPDFPGTARGQRVWWLGCFGQSRHPILNRDAGLARARKGGLLGLHSGDAGARLRVRDASSALEFSLVHSL